MHSISAHNKIPSSLRAQGKALLLLVLFLASLTPSLRADDRRVQKRVPPVYPELAKRMRISGVVRVEATVAADGSVTLAKATTGNKMLTSAAEDAVRKWKFVPADSQSTVDIEVNFEVAN
jgi:TonB family protein